MKCVGIGSGFQKTVAPNKRCPCFVWMQHDACEATEAIKAYPMGIFCGDQLESGSTHLKELGLKISDRRGGIGELTFKQRGFGELYVCATSNTMKYQDGGASLGDTAESKNHINLSILKAEPCLEDVLVHFFLFITASQFIFELRNKVRNQ